MFEYLPGSKVCGDHQGREAANKVNHLMYVTLSDPHTVTKQKVPLEGGERTKGKTLYTHPTAIINAPKLLEPAVLTEEPGRWYGVDDHIEERVHQEGLEVHPGRLGMLRGMSKMANNHLSAIAPETREVLRAQRARW